MSAVMDLSRIKPGFADPVQDAQRSFRTVLEALSHPGRVFDMPVALDAPAGLSVTQTAVLLALADYDTPVWVGPKDGSRDDGMPAPELLPSTGSGSEHGRSPNPSNRSALSPSKGGALSPSKGGALSLSKGGALSLSKGDIEARSPMARNTIREDEARQFLRFHCGCPLTDDASDAQFIVLHGLAALPALDVMRLGDPAYPDRSATLIVEVAELATEGPLHLRGPGIRDMQSLYVAGWTNATTAFMAANRALFPRGVDLLLTCGSRIVGLPRTTLVNTPER